MRDPYWDLEREEARRDAILENHLADGECDCETCAEFDSLCEQEPPEGPDHDPFRGSPRLQAHHADMAWEG